MAEPTIRMIWGLAKSPELSMTSEELHLLVSALTGRDSIKDLNRKERGIVIGVLQKMKDSASGRSRRSRIQRGNTGTENQRKKIYMLAKALGWEKQVQVNGMAYRMFGVASVEWLDYRQCSKLIEAMKSMVERREREDAGQQGKDSQDS